MLYKHALLTLIIIAFSTFVFSQDKTKTPFQMSGKPIVRVFANYHTNFGGNEDKKSVDRMEIKRAYLGYKSTLSENLSLKLIMDVGNEAGRYSAYLKIAELKYKKNNLTVNVGLIATKQFKVQEGFWGYRYLRKSFQDQYKYNGSADLGLSVTYKLNKLLSVDAIVQNGEGYKHVNSTGTYRGGLGTTLKIKPILFRVYYDISAKPEVNRQNIATFLGYKFKDVFRIGAEYNYQLNHHFEENHNKFGYSAYATYIINSKYEVFARYDNSNSNVTEDNFSHLIPQQWNIDKDEQVIIAGLQYKPIKTVKLSVNYRRTQSAVPEIEGLNWLFFNLEFKL